MILPHPLIFYSIFKKCAAGFCQRAGNFREVLECASPLALLPDVAGDAKAPEGWRTPRRCREICPPHARRAATEFF